MEEEGDGIVVAIEWPGGEMNATPVERQQMEEEGGGEGKWKWVV
jgi:hypothetical protein